MRRHRFVVGMMLAIVVGASGCITTEPAPVLVAAGPTESPGAVTCEGPFARDTSHKQLVAAFGASNVVFKKIIGAEDITESATVLYPRDPARRLKILWQNKKTRSLPEQIVIEDKARWTAGQGLRLGLSVEQAEALNRTPFMISLEETDFFGTVQDWRGGALEKVPGGRSLRARFGDLEDLKAGDMPEGGGTLSSSDPKVRPLKLTLKQIFIDYLK